MKKIIFLLTLISSFGLVACSNEDHVNDVSNSSNVISNINSTESEKIKTLTIPASFFDDSIIDMETYAKENDFSSATRNDDGSVTIELSTVRYNSLLNDTKISVENYFSNLITEDKSITEITHSDNFSKIEMFVDKDIYNSTLNMTPLTIYITTSFYRTIFQIEDECTIIAKDNITNEIIEEYNYPLENN